MRVAIAGSGDITRYFTDEFTKKGHEVVILCRSLKPQFNNRPGVSQIVIDFSSVESIRQAIDESDALVCTILDYTTVFTDIHLSLIEACRQSTRCKRFIPSEYRGNLETHPEEPGFYFRTREPVRKVLREQNELEWTLVSVGWLVDHVLPSKNRYLKEIGPAFPVDLVGKKVIIPGTGREPVAVVSARDVAKALAVLLDAPSWEPYTYISAEEVCWQDVADAVVEKYPGLSVSHIPQAALEGVVKNGDEDERIIAEYQLFSVIGAGRFDPVEVQKQRDTYFKGIHFRTIKELFDAVERDPEVIA
ncbi:hypothetical protein AJ80_06839 [Polytolypa hystricis UAMH7299]|uniref:NAD(P)-binding domain-containing protein n=1 Tax=Polytolypa hystricis (strain UAMH7299) TaxID=1447883 RepID=A0A2B7XU45_POLH7|nr:hypothetical protein AJ80_06839 [Polytolypa hystricis UAMH7299]